MKKYLVTICLIVFVGCLTGCNESNLSSQERLSPVSKKYDFTGKKKTIWFRTARGYHRDVTVRQIVALRNFSMVKKGDLGGWIQSEENLSHRGDCWVGGDAVVCWNASVMDNAQVWDHALLIENVQLFGNAMVFDRVEIKGNAKIGGDKVLSGKSIHGIDPLGNAFESVDDTIRSVLEVIFLPLEILLEDIFF